MGIPAETNCLSSGIFADASSSAREMSSMDGRGDKGKNYSFSEKKYKELKSDSI